MRRLWLPPPLSASLALGASLALVLVAWTRLPLLRLSTLELPAGLPSVFLWTVDRERGTCRLGDRGESARRRDSEPGEDVDGVARVLHLRDGGAAAPGWQVTCRDGGARLFLPVEDAGDWALPVIHRILRAPQLGEPRFRWVHFHVDRLYRGLYLRVDFSREARPDLPARDDRDELIFLEPGETFVTDRQLAPLGPRRSRFLRGDLSLPLVLPGAAGKRLLSASAGHVLLYDPAAGTMRPLGFPFPLAAVIRRASPGMPVAPPRPDLIAAIDAACPPDAAPLPPTVLAAELRRDLDHFVPIFRRALRAHATLAGRTLPLDEILACHASLEALGLDATGVGR